MARLEVPISNQKVCCELESTTAIVGKRVICSYKNLHHLPNESIVLLTVDNIWSRFSGPEDRPNHSVIGKWLSVRGRLLQCYRGILIDNSNIFFVVSLGFFQKNLFWESSKKKTLLIKFSYSQICIMYGCNKTVIQLF